MTPFVLHRVLLGRFERASKLAVHLMLEQAAKREAAERKARSVAAPDLFAAARKRNADAVARTLRQVTA